MVGVRMNKKLNTVLQFPSRGNTQGLWDSVLTLTISLTARRTWSPYAHEMSATVSCLTVHGIDWTSFVSKYSCFGQCTSTCLCPNQQFRYQGFHQRFYCTHEFVFLCSWNSCAHRPRSTPKFPTIVKPNFNTVHRFGQADENGHQCNHGHRVATPHTARVGYRDVSVCIKASRTWRLFSLSPWRLLPLVAFSVWDCLECRSVGDCHVTHTSGDVSVAAEDSQW